MSITPLDLQAVGAFGFALTCPSPSLFHRAASADTGNRRIAEPVATKSHTPQVHSTRDRKSHTPQVHSTRDRKSTKNREHAAPNKPRPRTIGFFLILSGGGLYSHPHGGGLTSLSFGLHGRSFEWDLQVTFLRFHADIEHPSAFAVTTGLSLYTINRAWLRLRHGLRVGFWLPVPFEHIGASGPPPPHLDRLDERLMCGNWVNFFAGSIHVADLAFKLHKHLWLEISPANLGCPNGYSGSLGLRLET